MMMQRFPSVLKYHSVRHVYSNRQSGMLRQAYRCFTSTSAESVSKPTSRNPISRVLAFIRNDPFTRVSIMFGGTVLVVLLIVESFVPKPQKRVKPQMAIFPPRSTHPVIARDEVNSLKSLIPSFYSMSPSVAMVTGPSGCGKTELTNQFAHTFIEQCTPRIMRKPSKQPIVLYINGIDDESLSDSTSHCAHVLGVKTEELTNSSMTVAMDTILSKLANQKAKWLLIIDNVSNDTRSMLTRAMSSSGRSYRRGMVLMTSSEGDAHHEGNTIQLPTELSVDEAERLFTKVSCIPPSDLPPLDPVLSSIRLSPISVSLAGLTVRIYNHFYNSPADSLATYVKFLNDKPCPSADNEPRPFVQPLELYMEALSACDANFMYSIDLIGSCDQLRPLPVSVLRQHLKHQFFKGTSLSDIFSSTTSRDDLPMSEPQSNISNYLLMVKNNLPGMGGNSAHNEDLLQQQLQQGANPSDPLRTLLMSPFIRVSDVIGYDIQLVHIHPLARPTVADNFMANSIDIIEENELKRAKAHWERTAIFKKYRAFDPKQSLVSFRASLPGLKEGRVQPEERYDPHQHGGLPYAHYIHRLSHHNRIITSMNNELRYLQAKDTENRLIRKHLQPHLLHLHKRSCVMDTDALSIETSILGNSLALSHQPTSPIDVHVCDQYQRLLDVHTQLHGSHHPSVATILNTVADIHYQNGDHLKAIELLMKAIKIFDGIDARSKTTEQCVDHAHSLSLLGHVYSASGNRKGCVKYLEQSMMIYQNIPSDNEVTKAQRKVVAATVTDLGHAYIMLGDFNSAKKYLDLAAMAQKGIHGDYHPEVLRVLNIQSVVYALMGSTDECKVTRREAGDIQKELTTISDIV